MAALLKERGYFFVRFAGSVLIRSGVPDFYVQLDSGRACWIEVKAPGRYRDPWRGCAKDSPAQFYFLQKVAAQGALTLCVDSLEAVAAVLH